MMRRTTIAALCLVLPVLLTACSGRSVAEPDPTPATDEVAFSAGVLDKDVSHVAMVISAGETALLDELEGLRSIDLSGSENVEEIIAWAAEHPDVDVTYTVTLPDGTVVDNHTKKLDLSSKSGSELEAAAPSLALLPKLEQIALGSERADVSWEQLAAVHNALPQAQLQYSFDLYGQSCDLSDTTINLYHVPVADEGRLVQQVMALMPQLTYVDMDESGVSDERMEEIRLSRPDVKVVWRVWFGDNYSVRTDVERILASKPSSGGMLTDYNVDGLYHCHDVKYLDIGHNDVLTDIGFVAEMPKLEVVVLSMCGFSDASPLAQCTELEYLEMFNTLCTDLSPLSGLDKLRHLNVACIGLDAPDFPAIQLKDITPLYSLTELERLWLGAFQAIPTEQIEEMQRRAPNCEINTTVYVDPSGGHWRYLALADYINTYVDEYHERYILLREQFGNYENSAYSLYWNDPLY